MTRVHEEMHNAGYIDANVIGMPNPILYNPEQELLKFYQPDLMVRKGYIRIGGSIGFAVGDSKINGGLDVENVFNPSSGCMASVRIENFINLMKLGAIEDKNMIEIPKFVNELVRVIENVIPSTLKDAKDMFEDGGNWLSVLLRNGVSNSNFSSLRNVRIALNIER